MESAKKMSEDRKGKIGCAVFGAPFLWIIICAIVSAGLDNQNTGMVVGTIITIFIVACVFLTDVDKINEAKIIEATAKDEIQNILNNTPDCTIDDSYVTEDYSAFIGVDEKNRKIIVGGATIELFENDTDMGKEIDSDLAKYLSPHIPDLTQESDNHASKRSTVKVNYEIIEAKSILGVEVTENGKGLLSSSANTNTLGMAAVGGLLFGGAGAIVGAISGSNAKSKITEISLRIAKDDIKTPYVGINFVPSVLDKGSDENNKFMQIAERWYGILNILMEREKRAAQTKV